MADRVNGNVPRQVIHAKGVGVPVCLLHMPCSGVPYIYLRVLSNTIPSRGTVGMGQICTM